MISTWRRFASARVRSELQYPLPFLLSLCAQIMSNGIELVAIWAVFSSTHRIGGWTPAQVMWLYAVTTTAFGAANMFVSPIEDLPEHIRTGRFDSYLLRPTPLLTTVLADGFEVRRAGRMVPGLVCVAFMPLRPDWFGITGSIGDLAATLAVIAMGACIYGGLFLLTNTIAFWLIDSREVANAFTYGGLAAARYPIDILPTWIRRLFIWVMPIGFVAWLPGTRLLDVPGAMGLPTWIGVLSPIAALTTALAAGLVWRLGVRRYESTGS